MRKRTIFLLLACMMVFGVAVGGTLAWLTAETDNVQNKFTTSDIGVGLKEEAKTTDEFEFKMIPGWTITKDPKAQVTDGSEDCYLFVKVVESDNFDDFMTYEIADDWTETSSGSGIYYRIFDSQDSDNANAKDTWYSILKNDQVVVKDTVTKKMMDELTDETKPSLTFDAAAVQLYKSNTGDEKSKKFSVEDALKQVTWTDAVSN